MTSIITLTPHKEFDYQTQVKLDELWASWSKHDQAGDYLNEAWMEHNTKLLNRYDAALAAAKEKAQ